MNKNILFICLLLAIFSCKKKEEELSSTPGLSIEFLSISPSTVKENTDSVTITFSYDDSDGDLGENDPNVTNLFVTDTRNNVEYQYRISHLAPEGTNMHIGGKLNVNVQNISITNGATSQPVTYTVYVKDRAGNLSNSVTTSAVMVVK